MTTTMELGGGDASLPYSVSGIVGDPDTARALFREGATLLFLNVPAGTLVGLDGQVFTVGPNFMGVKMIPPGVHLVTTQAVQLASRHEDGGGGAGVPSPAPAAAVPPAAAPALAAFLDLPPRSVLVRGWDARAEALAPLADAEEESRFAAGARRGDFDRGLAPYDLGGAGGNGGAAAGAAAGGGTTPAATTPTSGWARWRALAGLITPSLARRLMPPPLRLLDGRECAGALSVTAEAAEEAEGQAAAAAPLRFASAAERRLDAQLAEGRRRQQQEDQPTTETTTTTASVPAPPPPPSAAAAAQAPPSSSSSALARLALASPLPEPSRARYTPVERLSKPAGLTPAQLTEANLDRSTAAEALLRAVVERERAGDEGGGGGGAGAAAAALAAEPAAALLRLGGPLLLGELQFAFAAFAAGGQSLEGFHQWRSIACLLLGCERLLTFGSSGSQSAANATAAAAAFFAAFLRVLAAQLAYALGVGEQGKQRHQKQQPTPLLVDDDLLRQSFLRQGVRRFLAALRAAERQQRQEEEEQPSALAEVRAAADLVVSTLREGLGWEEGALEGGGGGGGVGGDEGEREGEGEGDNDDDDDDEDGPTVVDLDEGYAL